MKKPELRTELMEVTPKLATEWLETNTDNRNISTRWVEAIARDIADGHWYPNNASIALHVGDDGKPTRVVDGQHRLWAVVQAGKPVWTLVVFGDPANLRRENIDRVKPRSVADQLQLLYGVKNARQIASYCGVLARLERGETYTERVMTTEFAQEVRERHATALEWFTALTSSNYTRHQKLMRTSGVGGTFIYCYPTSPERLNTFATQVRDGENLAKDDPAYAFRVYLERASSSNVGSRDSKAHRHEVVVVTMRAVYAFLKGEHLQALKPGALLGGGFYKDALKFFGRVQQKSVMPTVRKRSA